MSNEIKLYQQPIDLALYPKREQEVFNALQTALINTKPEIELYEIFRKQITHAYMISMFTPPEPVAFQAIVNETMMKYKSSFGFIREGEINLIFTRGLAKEFGDFMGLSYITFVDWAKAYAKDLIRIKLTSHPKENNKPSDDEIYQLKKTNAYNALNEFKQKGTCGRFAVDVYNFFEEIKLITLTQEEKNEYWRLAKVEYKLHLDRQAQLLVTMEDKRKLDRDYNSALEGGKTARFVVISKRLIVDDFFRQIIMEETDLQILIEPK